VEEIVATESARSDNMMLFLPNSEKRKEWGDTGKDPDHLQKDMHVFERTTTTIRSTTADYLA
jgi:hypothetical protein